MEKYLCNVCGWVYDPAIGVPEENIKIGIAFQELEDSFYCPICGVGKKEFSPYKG